MNFLFLCVLLLGGSLSADVRTLPNPCSPEIKTLCSLMEAESTLQAIENSVNSNGEEDTYEKIEDGDFDSNGFWPLLTQKPDTTLYNMEKLVPFNPSVLTAAHTQLESELNKGNTWTAVTLGTSTNSYVSVAKSLNISSTHYASVLVKNAAPTNIICTGLTNSPCNAWKASELFGNLKYDLHTLSVDAITSGLNAEEYSSGDFKPVVVGTAGGTLGDTTDLQTSWIDTSKVGDYRELSFTESDVNYGGWAVPVTFDDGTSYQMGVTFVDTPDASLESTCVPTAVTPCVFTEAVSLAASVPSLATDHLTTLNTVTPEQGWTVEVYSTSKKYTITTDTDSTSLTEADDTTSHATFSSHANGWFRNGGNLYYMLENGDYLVVVPIVDVVLERSGSCTAAKYSATCSTDYQKSILGEIIRDSLFDDVNAIKTKFTNGNYNVQNWSVQLRKISDGSLEASSASTDFAIPTDVAVHSVAKLAIENSEGGFVEFNSDSGPYKIYTYKVLNDYYVQTGYINSFTIAPTKSPTFPPSPRTTTAPPTKKDSSTSLALSLVLMLSLFVL